MKNKTNIQGNIYVISPLKGLVKCLMNLEKEAMENELDQLAKVIKLAREEAEASLVSPFEKNEGLSLHCH